ncbi:hypothetical protein D9757_000302 [Collybiopsis confluens]|uniref:Uncharacterized protein n=1 Tax=Collybiopsis confluens TaxID=2823264 RepID=A0A8H5MGL4_9AGAR|nr:hypothetical protein D9757_000302 [Collybiopsis confluens]
MIPLSRQHSHSMALLYPSKLSSPRSSRSIRSSASSAASSSSSSISNYSFSRTSQDSLQTSQGCCSPVTTPITTSSGYSEFCIDCCDTHTRRKPKPKSRVIRPLPPLPPSHVRPLPQPHGMRKLPSPPTPPPSQQISGSRIVEAGTPVWCSNLCTGIEKKKNGIEERDRFIPEIDWETIMVEIIRSTSHSVYAESDADSIYTDATLD